MNRSEKVGIGFVCVLLVLGLCVWTGGLQKIGRWADKTFSAGETETAPQPKPVVIVQNEPETKPKTKPKPKPKTEQVYSCPMRISAVYGSPPNAAKMLADSYIRTFSQVAIIFTATNTIEQHGKVIRNFVDDDTDNPYMVGGLDISKPWTAKVLGELRDRKGSWYCSLTVHVDAVGMNETVYRITDFHTWKKEP
jgi:hypothetical protein